MRTSKKKQTPKGEGTGKLKIQPKTRYSANSYRPHHVPEIKLSGKWLQELGFVSGTEVVITTSLGMLVIQPMDY